MPIRAKFPGKCACGCGKTIAKDQLIEYEKTKKMVFIPGHDSAEVRKRLGLEAKEAGAKSRAPYAGKTTSAGSVGSAPTDMSQIVAELDKITMATMELKTKILVYQAQANMAALNRR